ncbi:hypothetical protein JCM30471_16820 [Desulfuromonas carbonis]|uniref:alpha/beta fold hydrolase n=1 Tax=Desulfuromonas sp. DDH964 TaxID=1823759 RepID=UPI00078DA7DD|nr:alpha/beta hydrolase [Desulfuromonas sp. DDH964]AMV73280.1 O-methylpimelyl-(acyl carrier protein) methylesterase [Desulfuromonas sp. DDH964]
MSWRALLSGLLVLCCWLSPAPATAETGRRLAEPIFGGFFHLTEVGQENPELLLLIHGLGDEAGRCWDDSLPGLADRYHVLVPDLPGFGRSSKENRLYSPENYAAFIDWLLHRYPGRPVTIVGHSLGGAIALAYAGRYGQDLERLVLVDTVGLLNRVTVSKTFLQDQLNFRPPFFPASTEGFFDRLAGRVVEKFSRLPANLGEILTSATGRERVLGSEPAKIAALALVETDFTPILAGVTTPTWLLWGEQDAVAPRRIAQLLQGVLPVAELKLLPGLGHTPMRENPAAFSRALHDALTVAPQPPPRPQPPASERIGRCQDQSGVTFSGNYQRLEINNCREVTIEDAYIGEAVIDRSLVSMRNSVIAGAEVGLFIRASTLIATAVEISGATALVTDQSRLDLAGARLTGREAAIRCQREKSTLVFSVSELSSKGRRRPLHEVVVLAPGETL